MKDTCDPPPSGINTKSVPNRQFAVGRKYRYRCQNDFVPTYMFFDSIRAECLSDLTWSLDPPVSCTSNTFHSLNLKKCLNQQLIECYCRTLFTIIGSCADIILAIKVASNYI